MQRGDQIEYDPKNQVLIIWSGGIPFRWEDNDDKKFVSNKIITDERDFLWLCILIAGSHRLQCVPIREYVIQIY